MAIYIYTGTPGSGKSAHAMKDITVAAQSGKPVLSNVSLYSRPFLARKSWKLDFVDTLDLSPDSLMASPNPKPGRESTRLLVIDEAQLVFNSRSWSAEGRTRWIEFFTQHRKLGWDVILIAQDINMIDKQIRGLIEMNFIHRKMGSFGLVSRILSFVTFHRLMGYVVYWANGRLKVGQGLFLITPNIAKLYDSSQMLVR